MDKILLIKRSILRKILNVLGVCTIGLIAACAKYGAEISTLIKLNGTIISKKTKQPIDEIQIRVKNSFTGVLTYTNESGKFLTYAEIEHGANHLSLNIQDIDGETNGSFSEKDTVIVLSADEMENGESEVFIELDNNE